jgi:alkaline phosphatase
MMKLITRRDFLRKTSVLAGVGLGASSMPLYADDGTPESTPESITFGLVADVHYADIPTKGDRHYRDSLPKLKQAINTFNKRSVKFAVELGDFVDAGPSVENDIKYLRQVSNVFHQFKGDRHFVFGNHCVHTIPKKKLLDVCKVKTKKTYYSFDHGNFHFIVLDGDFREDGVEYEPGNWKWTDTAIPAKQLKWLKTDLAKAKGKVVTVFVHQNMDDDGSPYDLDNSAILRQTLEDAGNVVAVFQGHRHPGRYRRINGIHYCTLRAMVVGPGLKNNSYAIATLRSNGELHVESFGKNIDFKTKEKKACLK